MKNNIVSLIIVRIPVKVLFFLKKIIRKIFRFVILRLIQLFPIKKDKIVFSNFFGKGYGDNPKYITEVILKHNQKWDIVWLSNSDSNIFPNGVRTVKYGSIKAMYELSTAKMWIDNVRNSERPPKRKGQYFLQTWHGGIGFKKIEKEVEEKLSPDYVASAKMDGKSSDAIISSAKLCTELYQKNFWLGSNTEILEVGLPRNDALFDEDLINKIKTKLYKQLEITESYSVILYMPTFRDSGRMSGYILDFDGIIRAFERQFGRKFVVLVRLHPNAQGLCNHITFDNKVINVTQFPDAQELFHISDYLITDYSSAAFDFALLQKPVFLCTLDLDEYCEERGFSEIFDMVPFTKATTIEELIYNISHFSKEDYFDDVEQFKMFWMPFDNGTASEKVYSWIKKRIGC